MMIGVQMVMISMIMTMTENLVLKRPRPITTKNPHYKKCTLRLISQLTVI